MKPNYKNWVPKGMVYGFFGGCGLRIRRYYHSLR